MTSLRSQVSAYSLMKKDKDINLEIDKQIREAICTSEAIEAIKEANIARLRAANTITQTKIEDERFKERFKDMTRIRNVQGISTELKRLLALPVWSKIDSDYNGTVLTFLRTVKDIENTAVDINISTLSNEFKAALFGSFEDAYYHFVNVPDDDGYDSSNVVTSFFKIPDSRKNIVRSAILKLVNYHYNSLKKTALRYNVNDQKIEYFDQAASSIFGNLTFVDRSDKDRQLLIGQGFNVLQKLKIVNSITNILSIGFNNWALLSMLASEIDKFITYATETPPSSSNSLKDYISSFMLNKKYDIFILPKVLNKFLRASDFIGDTVDYLRKINDIASQTAIDDESLYNMTLQITKNEHELADHAEADPADKLNHVSIGDSAVLDSATAGPSSASTDVGSGFAPQSGLSNRSTRSAFSLLTHDKAHFSENAANPYVFTNPSKAKIKGGSLSGEDEKRLKILEAYIKTGGNSIRSLAEYAKLKKRS